MFPSISIVYPQQRYIRQPPRLIDAWSTNGELLAWFYKQVAEREAHCLPHGYFPLGNCYVYDGAYVFTEDDGWLGESVQNYNAKDGILPSLLDQISKGQLQTVKTDNLPVVVLAAAGFSNYGHVLTDIMPKLLNVQRAGFGEIILLLPEAMANYLALINLLVGQLGINARIELCPRASLIRLDSAFYMAPISRHNTMKSPNLLMMRDILIGAYGAVSAPPVKLFVARSESDSRAFVNQAEVAACLKEAGFETVYPAELTIPEQVRLFARASHVIGGLGAGLTNILYAPKSANVMMIDPGLIDFYFWDLASLAGQQFTWVFAGEIAGWSLKRETDAFEVDIAMLRAALKRF